MVTVVSVCWSEPYAMRNRTYDGVWVQRLKRLVAHHLHIPHRFVCLTNLPEIKGVDIIPFENNWAEIWGRIQQDPAKWRGCWSKVELFRNDLPGDRFLYLDLDTLPVGRLDELVTLPASLIGIHPKTVSRAGTWTDSKRRKAFCSGVMVWDKDYANIVYDLFDTAVMMRLVGDQDWIAEVIERETLKYGYFSQDWICSLRNIKKNIIPSDIRVICCSPNGWRQDLVVEYKGKKYKWVEKLWKTNTII